jgi:peptide/nickel transport system substrate-binding protein
MEEEMVDRKIKRREFLKLSAVGALGAVASACGTTPTIQPAAPTEEGQPPPTPQVVEVERQVTVEVPAGRSEPPLLADRVAAGTLPPIDERLPQNPEVVGGREAVGVYGGEIRMVHFDPVWFVSNYGMNGERMLHYSDIDLRTIVPNVFESWEVSPDGKVWTFRLRRGMKWSDGTPLTTEDIRFWWEDVMIDTDLSSGVQWQFRFGGEPMKVDIVDDFTFTFTFAATFGNFAAHLTRWHSAWNIILPAHYLKQFHARYTDEATLEGMAQELSLENWEQLFWNKNQWGNGIWQGPDNVKEWPSLSPWIVIDSPQEGLYIWERNPFYWKIDLAGNQLPYVDYMRFDYIQTTEAIKLKLTQNELDYVGPHDVTIAQYPYYKENEARSNYVVGDYLSCMTDRYILFPQHVLAEDEELEEIVNHPNWVKALSVAIDREEINESIYFGLARMGQSSPMSMSKYYKPQYGTAWAQYDPDLANQLLDEMGLDQKDSEGYRLRPNGERLRYNIEHAGHRVGVSTGQFTEMVVTFWREIGIDATTREIQESLYNERMQNALVHCGVWHQDRVTDLLLHIEPQWFIPTGDPGQGTASGKWAQWYTASDRTAEELVEPPDWLKELYGYFDQMTATTSEDERVALGQKIFDFLADRPLQIGSVLESPAPLLFNKNLRNLPRPKAPVGWDTFGISTYHPEAFFYEGGQRA